MPWTARQACKRFQSSNSFNFVVSKFTSMVLLTQEIHLAVPSQQNKREMKVHTMKVADSKFD